MIDDHIVDFLPVPSLLFLVSEQNSLRSNARKDELEGKGNTSVVYQVRLQGGARDSRRRDGDFTGR